jgi:peptidoglycan/LPS O-acetylase OafA/YrhL
VALGALIAVSSFLVRLRFPADTGQVANLHLWEWPQCLGLFALGVASARRGWLSPVPEQLRRRCGVVALAATAAIPILIFTSTPLGIDEEAYMGGLGWPSLATCLAEGALAVAGCVWGIGFAERRLTRPVRPWLARSAYAAFLIQGPVLLGLAVALRSAPLPGDVKALLVAAGGVAGSYLIARPLVTRTPLGRIL